MIIKTTLLVPKPYWAITVWPFIFVRPEYAADKGLMVHENIHYQEQGILVPIWWIKYAFSKTFRVAAEVRAYKAQIAAGGVSLPIAASWLTTYDKSLTTEKALQLLKA
jgi:hypothetical protein